jgi:ABC-type branched-subunit amino acid transport system permease subunit
VVACGLVGAVNRTRLGRLLRGMSDSPVALETLGLSVNVTKVLVFCVSSFLAGVGGALFVAQSQTVSSLHFIPFNSLIWLAVLAISGRGRQSAAIIAAFVLEVLPSFTTDPKLSLLFTPAFGLAALVGALLASRPRAAEAVSTAGSMVAAGHDRVSLRGRVGPIGSRLAVAAGASR